MLQLPQSTPRHFSRAQIAEITRGGKVTVRVKKPRACPITLRLGVFKLTMDSCIKAHEARCRAERILEPQHALGTFVHPMNVEGAVPTFTCCGPFRSQHHIKDTVRKMMRALRKDLPEARRAAKRPGGFQLERQQRATSMIKELDCLPRIELSLLKAMRAEERRVRKLQRAVQYDDKTKLWYKEYNGMWKAFHALRWTETVSPAGAVALIELASLIMKSGVMEPGAVPAILDRAGWILGRKGVPL